MIIKPATTEAPNQALQQTAPRVTVAAILAWTRPVRAWRFSTLVSSLCAPPSQVPRHAPPSLSLGSLGDCALAPRNDADTFTQKSTSCPNSHAFTASSFGCSPSLPSAITSRTFTPTTASTSPCFPFPRGPHHWLYSAAPAATRRGLGGASRGGVAFRLATS